MEQNYETSIPQNQVQHDHLLLLNAWWRWRRKANKTCHRLKIKKLICSTFYLWFLETCMYGFISTEMLSSKSSWCFFFWGFTMCCLPCWKCHFFFEKMLAAGTLQPSSETNTHPVIAERRSAHRSSWDLIMTIKILCGHIAKVPCCMSLLQIYNHWSCTLKNAVYSEKKRQNCINVFCSLTTSNLVYNHATEN